MTNEYFDRKAHLVNGRVQTFSPLEEELGALETACVAVPLLASTALSVSGEDRLDFLHGQVSNDIKRLSVGAFCDALMLNHKGHALAQMRVFRLEDKLITVTDGGADAFVRSELEAHIIFDQVVLEPIDTLTMSVQGKMSRDVIETALKTEVPGESSFSEVDFEGGRVLLSTSKRSSQGGLDLSVSAGAAPLLFERLLEAGAVAGGEEVLDIARVSAGIPNAEGEGGEGVLPQEAGLEPFVSYTKGCYLGQEIMARIEARGKLRRSLQGLKLNGPPEAGERSLTAEGKPVGRLGTVAEHPEWGTIALAVLRNDLAPDATLSIGKVQANAVSLPFTP